MPVPGPPSLGRGVVITDGSRVPGPWVATPTTPAAPVVRIDDSALADPARTVVELHRCWTERRAVVVELAVDPARFRTPWSHAAEPWTVDPEFEPWDDRLQFLVWANNYDARAGEPVWWWARKATRLGAVESPAGPADVLLEAGTPAWIDGGPRAPSPSRAPRWCTASRWSWAGSRQCLRSRARPAPEATS